MDLNIALTNFNDAFTAEYKKYLDIHKELDAYRGKELTEETAKIVNDILKRIQEQYILLYGALHFIKERSVLAANAMHEYQLFIDTLKLAGASETKQA